jgi:carboxyl-terminal processing protease
MTRSSLIHRSRLAATALLLALSATGTFAAARSPCKPSPADGDVVSQSADALSLSLDAAHPAALANWDVRWWERRRVWIALVATNRGDATAHLLPHMVVDAHADGGAAMVLVGTPLVLAPHAHAVQDLAIYVPDEARTLGVRMLGAALAEKVDVAISLACSDARFDPGEMAPSVRPLFEETAKLYFDGFVDPLSNPVEAFDAVHKLASGAQDAGDVVWAFRGLMQSLRDDHGFALAPGEALPARRTLVTRAPEFVLRADGTAIVRLRAVDTTSDVRALAWATMVHDCVADLAAHHPRAWIVDLRDHDGDSPWPSFAGLSTLLDGPAIGAFVSRHDKQEWIADRGIARVAGGPALVDVQAPPEPPFRGPVAVLIGPDTRNAGEDVAVAFRGRARTRFFGAPTAGFPNLDVQAHRLSDGSTLGVLETRAADRTGVVHRVPVEPDVVLAPDAAIAALPQEALDWVLDERANSAGGR